QGGRFAVVAVARVAHAHGKLAAAALDLQALDAVAEAAGDAHLVALPGPDLDPALEVAHFDFAACIERPGFVDRRGRQDGAHEAAGGEADEGKAGEGNAGEGTGHDDLLGQAWRRLSARRWA